jgi:hypothetical protein
MADPFHFTAEPSRKQELCNWGEKKNQQYKTSRKFSYSLLHWVGERGDPEV